jgi:hypothetical protein
MVEIIYSPQLKTLSSSLDDTWEKEMVDQLPFPIAYHLKQLQNENYPWDFLLKDMLHILLKYLAIVATSDYLHSRNEPDFDVNEQLQNFRLNMSEGHWLRLLRTCSTSKNILVISELKEIFNTVEKGSYYAKISWPEINIKSDNAGILSTLVTLRNKLLGHGKSPSEQDKQILKPQILGLLRTVLYLYQPVWKYDLVYVFERKKDSQAYVLKGINNFIQIEKPGSTFPSKCFLAQNNNVAVNLFPLVLSDKPKLTSQITLIDLQSEQYILEHIDTHFKPEYIGVSGANYKSESAELNHLLENMKVWTKRQDVELDEIFGKLKGKTLENIEDIEFNNLFKTRSYLHRKDTEDILNSFVEDNNSRALIVSGVSGCGKTTSIIHFVNSLLSDNKNVLLIRAIELPERVQKPREFERWMVEYLGYNGKFEEVLNYVKTSGSGKLVIILDGINEFTAIGRDASKLFNNINHFLATYQDSAELKAIISMRSDTLNFFLPGGKLPVDAIEELYYKHNNYDYFEIGTLSVDEGLKLLEIFKIPTDKARNIMGALKESMQTPQVFYKIASGAITPEDLKGMDTLKITGRFLEKRLGRDKELKKLCHDLVGVMGKTKDMNLTEEQLTDKAPKLLAKLKDNNNHFLNVLSDLEIIQQIKSEDKTGNPSSAILLAHDTIFEALSKGVDKSTKKTKQIPMAIGIIMMIFSLIMMMQEKNDPDNPKMSAINQKVNNAILEFDSILTIMYPVNATNEIADQTLEKIKSAYHPLFEVYRLSEIEFRKMYDRHSGFYIFISVLIFIGWGFLAGFYLPKLLLKIDKRESRIQFFGKNEKLKLLKFHQRLVFTAIILLFLLIAVFQNLGLKESQVESLTLATFIIYMLFLSIFSSVLMVRKTIKKCKESPLVNEYFLSKFGRYMVRFEQLFHLVLVVILIPLFFIPLKISPSVFYPEKEYQDLKLRIRTELSSIDIKTIEQYPVVTSIPVLEFVNTNGQSLERYYSRTMEQKFKEGGKINFYQAKVFLFLILFMVLVTFVINILPFEIAARKYYKTT